MSDVLTPSGSGSVAAYGIDPRTAPPDSLPAPVTNIIWSIDRPDVVVITPAADGLSCKVEAAPGGPQDVPATLTVSADSRAGVHLVETATLSVHQDDEAVSLGLKRV